MARTRQFCPHSSCHSASAVPPLSVPAASRSVSTCLRNSQPTELLTASQIRIQDGLQMAHRAAESHAGRNMLRLIMSTTGWLAECPGGSASAAPLDEAGHRAPEACAGTLARLWDRMRSRSPGKGLHVSCCIHEERAACRGSHLVRIRMKYGGPERPVQSTAAASDAWTHHASWPLSSSMTGSHGAAPRRWFGYGNHSCDGTANLDTKQGTAQQR